MPLWTLEAELPLMYAQEMDIVLERVPVGWKGHETNEVKEKLMQGIREEMKNARRY